MVSISGTQPQFTVLFYWSYTDKNHNNKKTITTTLYDSGDQDR
ncbi:hypothetical protein LMG33818_000820 [Halomonadaceae bacterium LMG 33818]